MGFLKKYLEDGDMDVKIDKIKKLIKNGQFEFVNGGMSQPDSACPVYMDIYENYYYGFKYIRDHL